jgi:hypothetical protein
MLHIKYSYLENDSLCGSVMSIENIGLQCYSSETIGPVSPYSHIPTPCLYN